ncbi:slit homolog 1 protein-like isoform X2 [Diorhabda carinulata]|nr:slit homolog 1 protein-like [Diorhabda sublineata]XP_056640291.1 slit homolog 1 protein-like [Diorhabda sublineata]XP_057657805.1 slit homolog 1 protein-like isoform X2 [Diorhabda carinulata]XP_057657806.1 slit homolog 1 protein-like isoform X2 [Diorhabda carinulata]
MWWLILSLIWWCGSSAIPSTGPDLWKCPEIDSQPFVECSCDMPHTLRCTGDKSSMKIIGETLRAKSSFSVSLLDCTIQNLTSISEPILEEVSLHGLVISSGELKNIVENAFDKLASPLQALGLPNNQLETVPISALRSLPELDRLDISGNRLRNLDRKSFEGLRNLSFIDISDNLISKITPDAFDNLPQLKILRLRGNQLTISAISKLNRLSTLEELDLSENMLIGPIGPSTCTKMSSLKDLQLSHNTLSSIKMGSLQGLTALTSLRLQHNQIDVIEDHAFSHLSSLLTLELAHNRIVAVSGASLAHLQKLTYLDMRHNFLRALTADLIQPLRNLRSLKLDENDISIVASDAFKPTTSLEHFTLSENPLNCDCSLSEFATWLNNSTLNQQDKSTAVCTTPPHLENGLLIEMPTYNLICGDEDDTVMTPISSPFKARINLEDFTYDGTDVKLSWNVQDEFSSYTCDAIFVYEEEGPNEVLIESNPIKCNSSDLSDPKILNVTLPKTIQLRRGNSYRYCIVLLETVQTDDVSLILGCSDIIPLVINAKLPANAKIPRVVSVLANLTSDGELSIGIDVYPGVNCELNVAVLEQSTLLSQKIIECSNPKYNFFGLNGGPYRVCANVVTSSPAIDVNKSRCVTVFKSVATGFTNLDVAFVSVFLVLCIMVIILVWGVKKVLVKPKTRTHQCFLPPECDKDVQHNRYVKLQATTKL